jgi:uncharacterized protein
MMLALLLSSLVGLSMGMLGAGGSLLAIPILKYAAGMPTKEAVATSLATVSMVALVGAIQAWREDRLKVKEALTFAVVSSLGTLAGVRMAVYMSDRVQMGIFIAVMVYAVVAMIRKKRAAASNTGPESTPAQSQIKSLVQTLAVGVLTGIVGVGGGFLIVPALVSIYSLPMKIATGTSLGIIFLNSLLAFSAYTKVISLDWSFTAQFVGVAVLGLGAGMVLSRKLATERIEQLFLAAVVLVTVLTILQEAH